VYNADSTHGDFAVIVYDDTNGEFVYSARRWKWYGGATSYICQLQKQGLFKYANYPAKLYSIHVIVLHHGELII